MKKQLLLWTLILGVSSITFVSCKKDKENKPQEPIESYLTDDRDQRVYKTIKIGNQTWFAENLKYTGPIAAGYINDPFGKPDSTAKYGPIYTWDAAIIACPKGWHLPSDSEWKLLEHNIGMVDADTDKYGFSEERGVAQKLGTRLQKGGDIGFNFVITDVATDQDMWTSTTYSGDKKYIRSFTRNDNSVYRASNGAAAPLCVRCLKD